MHHHNKTSFVAAAGCAAFCAVTFFTGSPLRAAEKPDYKVTAERIVGECAGVKAGDRVVVRGDVRDIEFVEELTLAVWRRSAEPIQVLARERANRRYFDEVPAKVDAVPAALSLKLAEIQTVEIGIWGEEFPDQLNTVPATRTAAGDQRREMVYQAKLKAGVRQVSFGNGLYPTEATAKRYGLTKAQLADLYWAGINVDYGKLQAKDEFAGVDVGINPNVNVPAGSKLMTYVPAGTVTLSFGGNAWAEGSNPISWGSDGSMNGCTLTVDGQVVIENGVLK